MNFQTGEAVSSKDSKVTLRIVHGVLMAVSWGVLSVVSIIIARWFKWVGHTWFILHKSLNIIAILLTLIAFVISLVMVKPFRQTSSVALTHAIVGLIVVILSVFQGLIGQLADKLYNPNRVTAPLWPDKIHWYCGRFVQLLAIPTIVLGMLAEKIDKIWIYIFVAWIVLVIVVFIVFAFKGKTQHAKVHSMELNSRKVEVRASRLNI